MAFSKWFLFAVFAFASLASAQVTGDHNRAQCVPGAAAPFLYDPATPGLYYRCTAQNVYTALATVGNPFQVANADPAHCNVGNVYFNPTLSAGANLKFCTSTDTWTQMSGTGGGGAATLVNVAFSASPTFTCPSATTGTLTTFVVAALTSNVTSSTLASCTIGQQLQFILTQNVTGGFTISWPSGFSAMGQPSPLTSASTVLSCIWDGVNCNPPGALSGPSVVPLSSDPGVNPPTGSLYCWADSTLLAYRCRTSTGAYTQMVASGAFSGSTPATGAITMTGVDVIVQTIPNVILPVGGCLEVKFQMLTSSASTAVMLYRDTTSLGQVGAAGGGPNLLNSMFHYCNDAGTQLTQHAYSLFSNFCGSNPCSAGLSVAGGLTWPLVTTATDWTVPHSLVIRANAASGSVTGLTFTVRGY